MVDNIEYECCGCFEGLGRWSGSVGLSWTLQSSRTLLSFRAFLWCFLLIKASDRLKTANRVKQEQARLEVEIAEDDLVQKTEMAITLMKTVLENVCLFFFCMFRCR